MTNLLITHSRDIEDIPKYGYADPYNFCRVKIVYSYGKEAYPKCNCNDYINITHPCFHEIQKICQKCYRFEQWAGKKSDAEDFDKLWGRLKSQKHFIDYLNDDETLKFIANMHDRCDPDAFIPAKSEYEWVYKKAPNIIEYYKKKREKVYKR